jgi:N6-L-threonylcarbamoyladenine synthase
MSSEYLLAIETTCDETAAAVIRRDGRVMAEAIASQEELHGQFDGVVPEIAARAHLERIVPILRTVMNRSGIQSSDLAAIAVATEPGLPGSLLVGLCAAKALCIAWNKPLVAINHIHAHVYACQVGRAETIFPCIGFVVSGGHTHLYRCSNALEWELLGGTIDDAAGEAFDKVAVMLGLPFPGGPQLAKLADHGNPKAIAFPRPLLNDSKTIGFSFSGLKTAVRYHLVGAGKQDFSSLLLTDQHRADISASFQQAVVDCLVAKAILALKTTGIKRLCVGGGVAANQVFRSQLQLECDKRKYELMIAPTNLCTDNAVMGALAWESLKAGKISPLDIDARAGLVR